LSVIWLGCCTSDTVACYFTGAARVVVDRGAKAAGAPTIADPI
jgi:hypothetical protein